MAPRLFGVETEYAFNALDPAGRPVERGWALASLLAAARARLVHAADAESPGLFLQNASRLYVDCGHHPELSTPECADPWTAVRYTLAGDRILADLAAAVVASHPQALGEVVLSRRNVDYGGTGATWGCHESYLTSASPRALGDQLLPHLVSRIVFTGAGGFDSRSRGLAFMLSPRAAHLTRVASASSTEMRGILHGKDEPLCSGYRRLHLICGESLCSETAAWLKLGTTALVVAMAEKGLGPGDAVALVRPVHAMRAFAADPTCRATAPTTSGRPLSAIAIQRRYLALAEAHAGARFMPPWAPAVCERWRDVLDRLADAPDSLATTLDWTLKRALFARHAGRRGVAWTSLPAWTAVADRLGGDAGDGEVTPDPARFLASGGPARGAPAAIAALLARYGLAPDGLGPFLALRAELLELDARFGELGPRGLFAALDRSGLLAHHVPGVDDVARAMVEPPASGRARLRGEAVRDLAARRSPARASWSFVADDGGGRMLDLRDPFAAVARWTDVSASPWGPGWRDEPSGLLARLRRRFDLMALGDPGQGRVE